MLVNKLGFRNNIKIEYIDHHICHIASGFYASGFEKSFVISIDGFGDFCSLVVAKIETNRKLKILHKIYFPDSLGVFYEAMTQFSGFKNYGEEYKFMALACMGSPIYYEKLINNLFKDKNKIELNKKFFLHHDKNFLYNFEGIPNQNQIYSNELPLLFNNEKIISKDKVFQIRNDIAASVQKIFEHHLFNLINKYVDKKYSKNLVLTGGCALNSLANGKIIKKFDDLNLFVPYSPGDSGGSIGSAIISNIKYNKTIPTNLKTPYMGNSFTNDEINKIINKINIKDKCYIKYHNDFNTLSKKIVELLIKDNVGGFFQGRMEFGPRALGNRSIIASPINPKMKDIINKKIKKRENFRPFAPSILVEEKSKWFETVNSNLYMSAVEFIRENKRKFVPAITHFDGTGRVQDVEKHLNNRFYLLISTFYEKTGVPIILNTSFNENEPIVNRPEEAINCFIRTDIDFLVLENFLIEKKINNNV